jgi:hypothetical protein
MQRLVLSTRMLAVRNLILFFAVLLSLVVISRAGACRSTFIASHPASEPAKPTATAIISNNGRPPTASGHLRFHSHTNNTFRTRIATRVMERSSETLQKVATDLAEQITWPRDIDVTFEDCGGGTDAFYDDETHAVTICREIVDEFYQLFSTSGLHGPRINEAVNGALVSLLFHELGHALIDVLNLPITGREEDAADQLSSILLINRTAGGPAMALSAAEAFKILARVEKREGYIYWDDHSLHAQRYYDTLCLVYGSDEQRFAYLVKDHVLPEERAATCAQDYERIRKSWKALLQPYARESLWDRK